MKTCKNKKRSLKRFRYLTPFGYYESVRDAGKKSRLSFRKLIWSSRLDTWRRVESYGRENLRVGVIGSIQGMTVAHY